MNTRLAALSVRRTVQIAVWALLVVFAATAAWTLSHPVDAGPGHGPQYSLVAPDGTTTPLTSAQADDLYAAGSQTLAAQTTYTGTVPKASILAGQSADHWLMAKRWGSVGLMATDGGWKDIFSGPAAMVGGLMFTIAGWIWGFTFTLVGLALSLDAVAAAGAAINEVAGIIGAGIWDSGILALVLLMLIFVVAGIVLKGGKGRLGAVVLGCIIPLAALQLILGNVATSEATGGGDPTKTAAYALTPAGLAHRGNVAVAAAVEGISTGLMRTDLGKHAKGETSTESANDPCTYMYASLEKTYAQVSKDDVGYTSAAYVLLDSLWRQTFVDNLAIAQFGDKAEGRRGVCHHMEWQSNIPPAEHAALAGVGVSGSPYKDIAVEPANSDSYSPFAKIADQHDFNTSAISWIACDYGNGPVKFRSVWSKGRTGGDNFDEHCQQWASGKWTGNDEGADHLEYHSGKDAAARDFPTDTLGYKVIVSNLGQDNRASRMTMGLGTVLAALAYFAALVIPAFGCALATAGLAIMLALLPFTLLMMAIPSRRGGGNNAGTKMLKLTGSFILSKAMFLVILALLVQFVAIFNIILGVGR